MVAIETVAAGATIVAIGAGGIQWANQKRWRETNSAESQGEYLRDRLVGSRYSGGPLSGVITDVHTTEKTGVFYKSKKHSLARVEGHTEITIQFDRAEIGEERLNKEPFITVFSDPSEVGLADAEHLRTTVNRSQGHTHVQIRVHTMDYDEVGSWCSALPTLIWDAYMYEREHMY